MEEENKNNFEEVKRDMGCRKDLKRQELINKIKAINFAVIDLSLYLDTHPTDQRALFMHGKYSEELKALKDKYQNMFGPLTIYYSSNKWKWIDNPWPWERGNY